MSYQYTQAAYISRINAGVQGKIGILVDSQETANAAVRTLGTKVDMRSSMRRVNLVPNLFNGIFPYQCPSDLEAYGIIDLPAQAVRSDGEWSLVPAEEFYRNQSRKTGMVAFDDFNGLRTLLIDSRVNSLTVLASDLDSLTSGGGTWSAFGDATNLAADDSDFIKGNGSVSFDINAAGGLTAGIVNNSVNSVDISKYLGGTSAFFVWAKINSTTNLTSYTLRFGSDSSNYSSKTVTAQADGTAFVSGWNLLRFDLSTLTVTGTPVNTALKYFAIFMNKTAGKISETNYKFDYLVLKKGVVNYIKYYTKFNWQDSGGTYLENSSSGTDVLVADTDEYDLFVKQGVIEAMKEIGYPEVDITAKEAKLEKDIAAYQQANPSQRKIMMTDYYEYGSSSTGSGEKTSFGNSNDNGDGANTW